MDLSTLLHDLNLNSDDNSIPTVFKSVKVTIGGTPTEIVYAEFADNLFAIITQFRKLGSLVVVEKVQNRESQEAIYETRTNFGVETAEHHAVARYLAELLELEKPLHVFVSLQEYNTEVLGAIRGALRAFISS